MTEPLAKGRRRWIDATLLIAMAAALAFALVKASDSAGSVRWPSTTRIGIAIALVAAASLCSASSWVAMLGHHGDRAILARGWLYGQVGKYVPGGVVQYARVYVSARQAGVDRDTIVVTLPVHALCALLAPGGVAAIALGAAGSHLGVVLRMLAVVLGLAGTTAAVYRPLTATVLDRANRRWSRVPPSSALPDQRPVLVAFGWGLASSWCFGGAYAALLGRGGAATAAMSIGAFLVASSVGLLAIPFPSGLGVREAVLTALFLDAVPVADVLAAAIALRAVQVVVDLALAGAAALSPAIRRVGYRRGTSR